MSAVAAVAEKPSAPAADRVGVIAILQDQPTLERIQAIVRELHLDDELSLEPTLDAALRRMREGESPRVLILDLSDSAAPIAELSAARTVGGEDIKIVALGVVNVLAPGSSAQSTMLRAPRTNCANAPLMSARSA